MNTITLTFSLIIQLFLELISRSRMQEFTLTFWLVIKLFLELFLGLECKSLPLLFGSLSSCSQTYFQVQNARVYPYFLAHYQAVLRLFFRSRMQGFTLTFWLIIQLFFDLFLGLECKGLPLLLGSLSSYSQTYFQVQNSRVYPQFFGSLSSYSQTYFQVQNARVYPYFQAHYRAILRLISRSRIQGFTLSFLPIIELFLDLIVGLECKSLPLLFGSLSSHSQNYFQVQNARVYLYFWAHYQAVLRLISRSTMQGFTLTFWLIIQLFLDLFLGLECKGLPLLLGTLSSYSQTYFQVQNSRVYPQFLAYYRAILRLNCRSRMQEFIHTFWLIIELFLDLFLGLECKSLPLLYGSLSSQSQTYFNVQNARVYPYFLCHYQAILRLISRSRMQGFTLTFRLIIELFLDLFLGLEFKGLPLVFWLIIQLFLDLFLGLECKGLPLLLGSLSSYSQTYFQVQNSRVYPQFLGYYRAILRLNCRSRMQEFTLTFWLIIKLFLELFLGLESKGLPLLVGLLSSYSQTYFQVQNARVYPYFSAHYRAILRLISRSRMQGFTLTFWVIIELYLDLFLGLESKGLPFLFGSLSSYSQTNIQVQNARVYHYFLAHYPAILRYIYRSKMQTITLTFWLIIQLFLVLFLVLESKGLLLLFGPLSSYSQTNFQVQKAKVYLYFLAHYPSILKLISRSRMQGFTLTFWLIIKLFLD